MAVRIRQMSEADLEKLAEIYALCYKRFDVGERWTAPAAKRLLSHWLERQPDLAFVTEADGKAVAGFVAWIKPWWDGNHISDGEIFVHPDHQRKGIATKLSIAMYEKALKKYKAVSFDAYTFRKKRFPLSWYLSQGFVINEDWTMISGNVKSVLSRLKRNGSLMR